MAVTGTPMGGEGRELEQVANADDADDSDDADEPRAASAANPSNVLTAPGIISSSDGAFCPASVRSACVTRCGVRRPISTSVP